MQSLRLTLFLWRWCAQSGDLLFLRHDLWFLSRHQHQLSVREIAGSCGLPTSTVGDCLKRAEAAGLAWPLPDGIADSELQTRLMNSAGPEPELSASVKHLPDWPQVREQLHRKGVTLQLLWEEYHLSHPEGYKYSRFCELYHRWAKTLEPVLRQVHEPGQKLFVDWAGQTVSVHQVDGSTSAASLFVAVLGASNKTYVEAFPDQQLASWIAGHVHAFSFYNGVTRAVVPDNPKTAVIYANRYEPVLHQTYQEMAQHYGTVILPARAGRPRDKAKAEGGVLVAERQILAALRDQRFFSVGELNQAIRPLLDKLNAKPFQKLEGSRNSWFEEMEKGVLLPLPAQPYQLATWTKAKVNIDYHAAVDNHFYSVPYSLIHHQLDVRLTEHTVELFHDGKRVPCYQAPAKPPEGELLTVQAAADQLGVAASTLLRWLADGFVGGEQVTLGAPWRIRMTQELKKLIVPDVPPGYVTVFQAMRILGVSRQTIMQRVKRGGTVLKNRASARRLKRQ